mgnify:CR=1 FL=1
MRAILIPALILLCSSSALVQVEKYKCPIDDRELHNTFESKMENGRRFEKWKCSYGSDAHIYWIRV